jgi:hypothetical protein
MRQATEERKVTKRFIGLDPNGNIVYQKDFKVSLVSVIFEGRKAMGKKVIFTDGTCPVDYSNIHTKPSSRKLKIIVGDPRLLDNVRLIKRGKIRELSEFLPDGITNSISCGGQEVLIFENDDGDRIYVDANFATFYSRVRHLIQEV